MVVAGLTHRMKRWFKSGGEEEQLAQGASVPWVNCVLFWTLLGSSVLWETATTPPVDISVYGTW